MPRAQVSVAWFPNQKRRVITRPQARRFTPRSQPGALQIARQSASAQVATSASAIATMNSVSPAKATLPKW